MVNKYYIAAVVRRPAFCFLKSVLKDDLSGKIYRGFQATHQNLKINVLVFEFFDEWVTLKEENEFAVKFQLMKKAITKNVKSKTLAD